jgi:DNA-directed RNA polymerase beta subunit
MSFSKIDEVLEIPNLLEVQKKSYQWFLEEGLREVLRDVSPITDYSGNLQIEFIDYSLDGKPKYSIEECKERDANFAAPLKVNVRLTNRQTGEVEWTAIKRTHDSRYQAVADEGENGFTAAMGETFLTSVYTPSFTP